MAVSSAILLVSCPDRQGLVAAITGFIAQHSGNILDLDQHVDPAPEGKGSPPAFFMRVEWDLAGFQIAPDNIGTAFAQVAEPLAMRWELYFSSDMPRMAVFVSKEAHCLYDILYRWQAGEWRVEIPLIISNHADLEPLARKFDIPYRVLPITPENKREQEREQLMLLRDHQIDVVILARYMQILSPDFIQDYAKPIINIHHSFLPAFAGAAPYQRAHQRGVKIIGATSHYVTAELDAGPIIEQDVIRVDHRDTVGELIRKGKDTEKLVLSRAIRHHLQRRVLVYGNKTVVFA
jgi:formyltetrahydrofolate deformylase